MMMEVTQGCNRFRRFCCFFSLSFASVLMFQANGNDLSQQNLRRPSCHRGFFCPVGSLSARPCPPGTYGPTEDAESEDECVKCPPHHYCPAPGLSAPLLCGAVALQPLSGQDTCICPGEGQSFQTSDGQCQCTIGFQPSGTGAACAHKLFPVCRHGKTRTQYGDCMDTQQWSLHCRQQVCPSAEDFRGYSAELGLCVCREPPGRAACEGPCRGRSDVELQLRCGSGGDLELVWIHDGQVRIVSGGALETAFKQWDSHGTLQCSSLLHSPHPVYIVLTTDSGFLGVLSGLPPELQQLFPVSKQKDTHISPEDVGGASGVLNPTTCLQLGDVLLFTVDTRHYPQYDLDSLYNTNSEFDWGAFRQLEEELTLSWTPPPFFSVVFNQPGVYVFTLSSHQHKHMYVRVMPAGAQCYEPGPFFPSSPRHVTRLGISRRRNLLLRPDWAATGGLLFGAAVILCLCVTVLILFREYGWPEKKPIAPRYRSLQSRYQMDDYTSKGSRVTSLRRTHRGHQARRTQDSIQAVSGDMLGEFWDYEQQVDLEAFSTSTFYGLLLRQSLCVTTRLGQLTSEVKELYQGVLGKLQLLQPRLNPEEGMGEGYRRLRAEVEREAARRKCLASQLRMLLHRQLQVLKREHQAQQRLHCGFTSHIRESSRLLSKINNHTQPVNELQQQSWMQRLSSLVQEMEELVSAECQRQGAWELLGEGAGAKLLCPDTGTVLTKEHVFGPDGCVRAGQALHCDPITGLIRPKAHTHMLLSSCHTTAVPPDFFLHPHTGRVMPITGNVAYDPSTSTLVFTPGLSTGDDRKWESPLLPFIPYPTSGHSNQPLPTTHLRGLKPGQRLQLGAPMADPDTGVPVPILAVTIHPESGLVYPLGGTHVCPVTRLPQPIQICYPTLEPRTGRVALTAGVNLDPVTGAVLPVGGVVLGESFIDPLSGRMMRVMGASMRAGQVVPNAGGHQALLDYKVLSAMLKVVDILKPLSEDLGSDSTLQPPHPVSERSRDHMLAAAAAKELQQAWGHSLHSQLQLHTRVELLLDWAEALQQDGGSLGEMPLSGCEVGVTALLGMDYPDPMGSGLSVPVLGCHCDLVSGVTLPLAGTMEDPDGKGLVAIRYGSQTVDPVTGTLAPVVGARLDVSRKHILPVTASYWLTVTDQSDGAQVEALRREVCARNTYWQHQRQREDDLLSDLDSALFQHLVRAAEVNSSQQLQWSGKQLREAAAELQDTSQAEAQRRDAQHTHLALVLPSHVTHILTKGDGEEWEQQSTWQTELVSALDKVDVCMERLQQELERWTSQGGEWAPHTEDREQRVKELWEQCCSTHTQLEAALVALHSVRRLAQLSADTAQAVLCGSFCYKEYGLVRCCRRRPAKVVGSMQQRALPLLERLNQLLEGKQPSSLSPNPCIPHISGLSVKYGLDVASRVWTASVPVVKGISTQSLREPVHSSHAQDTGRLQSGSAPTHTSQRHTASSGFQSQENQPMKESAPPTLISVPAVPEEEWRRLLPLSPLFQLLKGVEQELKGWACGAGLLRGALDDGGNSFMDVLDAQWECEGELIPMDPTVLNPREFLVYQHGLFLMQTLQSLQLTPAVSLQVAASLPNNNYTNNAFRNSFFYQEAEETLFVRRQRLLSVGGFSLLLLHCLTHITIKDMCSDSGPAFQRLFFKVLQAGLGELFNAWLGGLSPSAGDANYHADCEAHAGKSHSNFMRSIGTASLLCGLQRPSRGALSEDEVEELKRKHREMSLFSHLEGVLREKSSEAPEDAKKEKCG